mgnify:CR=1 FL=1
MENRTKKEQEYIDIINKAISELVYDKVQVLKAYNYYHGKRDPEQYRHLEFNYGIGTPTSVEFIPMVRKHVDVLVGEYISTELLPRVTCKDEATLSNIFKEKQIAINNAIASELRKYLKDRIYNNISSDGYDKEVENRLEKLKESIENNFISDYEIAGQNIVNWVLQNRKIDFLNQRKTLLIDLLVSGMAYYRVQPSPSKTNIVLKVLNPLNTFVDRNVESIYLKNSSRAVIREYLTKDQILAKYGDLLTKDDLESLETKSGLEANGSFTYVRTLDNSVNNTTQSDGILGGFEVSPLLPYQTSTAKQMRTFPCYEVEWLKTEKEDGSYIVNRYSGVRIGGSIYILHGKDEDAIRSIDDPKSTSLSINGVFYSDRNGDPFSIMLKTADLQDRNDILYFYKDNIIAESGTVGDWIDVGYLPAFLGNTPEERLLKWKAYKKTGMALIDSTQEGMPSMPNTIFGGFDDTVRIQAIQAIDLAIQRNEDACSLITGVFRERLGGIEQRDAVTNVQVGVRQSSYITKQYYQIMNTLTAEMLIDILNVAKKVYKNGLSGTLILGEKLNKVFTALPEQFTLTDFDISIVDTSDIIRDQELIKQFGIELTKNNMVDPDILVDIITSSSLTQMKETVKSSLVKKQNEKNEVEKLIEQLQQLDGALKDSTKQSEQLQKQIEALNEEKLRLENEKLEFEKQIQWYKAKTDSNYKEELVKLQQKRVELEGVQLIDTNKRNDEIKND